MEDSTGVAAPATDADVSAFSAALGLPGLTDLHVHAMPERVQRKVWAFFDAHGDGPDGRAWPIHYRYDEQRRTEILRELGVTSFGALNYAHRPGMAAWLNAWSADYAARTPDALPSATFFPEPGVADYLTDALDGGAVLLKLHVQVGGFDPLDPLLEPAWQLVESEQVPVVTHCGSSPHPGRHTGPEPIAELLARHPDLVLVVAHLGMHEYHAFADLAEQYAGVHLDTTMAGTDYLQDWFPLPADYLPRLEALRDEVVLGSDFPTIPHPYAHQLQALVRWGFGDDWLRAVCWHNPRRLVGLPAGAEPLG